MVLRAHLEPGSEEIYPAAGPVYIVATKVTGVTRAIPHLSHPNAHAIIVSREGQTQVQETREAINEALVK
jgi:hypothetical protein